MSETKIDRRILRTKRMIRDALAKLMVEKGFDELTVIDIIELADINRGTFYLHYRDKYDLLEKCEAEIIEDIKKVRSDMLKNKEYRFNMSTSEEPSPYMIKLLDCVKEHAEFMQILLGPKGDPAFQVKLKEEMRANMEKHIQEHAKSIPELVPLNYLSALAISAQLGIIQHWLDTGMKESSWEVAMYMRRIMLGPQNK